MRNNRFLKVLSLAFFCAIMLSMTASAQPKRHFRRNMLKETSMTFFKSDEAKRIGDQVLAYQRVTGGWPKNIDMGRPMTQAELDEVIAQKNRTDDSTTDNGATNLQLTFLARLYKATGDKKYRDAFRRGIEYLLSGQYENGGWPQFWPNPHDYQVHITYNDDAMVNTLKMLRDIYSQKAPYDGNLTDSKLRKRAEKAFDKGIECILVSQIVTDGELTVWCQQHERDTYTPAPARAYELPSYCAPESASIVRLLMELDNPDDRVKKAVHAAMKWFDQNKLSGLAIKRYRTPGGIHDIKLVNDSTAGALWGRYYDLEFCEPYVCDRDGIPRRRLDQIGHERRNGYGWYSDRPAELYPLYEAWAAKYDPAGKVAIDLNSPGANVNGKINLERKPVIDRSAFDVIVKPGESIQTAIEKAPASPETPFKILVLNGIYNQKVIIDKPNIVLVGENRDSTIITLAETAKTNKIKEYNGKPVHNGVIVIQEGADDCVISGLTVYNNYGTTIENTTTHQMSIYGRATRTIVINSNVWADGNDALSLWAPESGGMYYHADLDVRSPGVDFICPRGWCYATRCNFYGDSRAMIWHDGRGNQNKKLVITNSNFDAKSPTPLGRYHHDSQFYLINCSLSKNVKDENIAYAYTDKVLDPCPWGPRIYYYGCYRDGGHSGWLADNLTEAKGSPEFHGITAKWTYGGTWDPESKIRDLWTVLGY